ncbi:hypothetical protein SUGI_0755020 [Cryptomeria japonica]|nr:hypothetical protein SUGI_0755020 [Cryptomeria japonica]
MENLLSNGLDKTQQALLTGCSVGGLATIIHFDQFRDLLPKSAKVKCMSDAAVFLDMYTLYSILLHVVHCYFCFPSS